MELERMGGVPHTSEFVKRCLTRYGLPGAFQSYVRINERRADKQRALLESNFAGGKEKSDRVKNVENKLLSLLFEFVVTPVETVATMIGQGKKIQTFNQNLGTADWEENKREEFPGVAGLTTPRDNPGNENAGNGRY